MSLELQSNINSLGRFRVVHKKLDGTEVDYGWASNIVTKEGQKYVLKRDQNFYLKLGKGTGEVKETDYNLFARLTADNFTNTSISNNSAVYNSLHTRINYELPENIMRKLQAKYNDVHIIPVCCGKYVYTHLKNVIITEMGLSTNEYYNYNGNGNDSLVTHTLLKDSNNQAIQVNVLEGEILEIYYALYGIIHDFEQMKTSLTMTYVDDLSKPDQVRTEEYDVFVEVKKPNLIEDNRYRADIIECLEDSSLYNRNWANRLDPKTGKLPTSVFNDTGDRNTTVFGYCIGDIDGYDGAKSRFSMPILFVPDDFTPGPITDAQKKFKIADQLYANYYCHQANYYYYYGDYYRYYYYYYSNIYHMKEKRALWPNMTEKEYEENMGKVYNNYGVMLDTYEKNKEEYGNIKMYYPFDMESSYTYNLKKITDTNDPYHDKRWWPKDNKYYNDVVKNVNNYLVTDLQKPAGSPLYIKRDSYNKTTSCVQVGARYFKISPYWGTTFEIPKNGIRMITTKPTAWNNYGNSFGSPNNSSSQYDSDYIQMGDYMMFITFVNKKDGTGLKHTAGYETSFEITWTNTDVDTANINIPDAKVSFKYPKMAKGETLSFDVTGTDADTTTRTITWITIANDTPEQDLPLTVDLNAKTIKANSIGTHTFKVFSKKAGCLDVPDTITIQIVDYLRFTDHPKWNTKEWATIVANAPTENIQVPIKNGTLVEKPIRYVTLDNRKYYSNEDIDNAAKLDS